MKAFLLHRDRDFDLKTAPPSHWPLLCKDLELDMLLDVVEEKDRRVRSVMERALFLAPSNDLETVSHRQAALKDSLRNPEAVHDLYALAQEALDKQRRIWGHFRDYPSGRLDHAVGQMEIFVDVLRRVRRLADETASQFDSEAFRTLFRTLATQLDDEYFAIVDTHLRNLKFRRGVLVSARLGKGLKGADYVLRKPLAGEGNWFTHLWSEHSSSYTLYLAPRDEAGANAMSELRDRGLGLAADALARSAQHILSFFEMFLTELAFYIGCLNLHRRLSGIGAPFVFPTLEPDASLAMTFRDLCDVGLTLKGGQRPVGNDIEADGKALLIVTGANQGGKTTFLRSLGAAQIMAQAGMFVVAETFRASVVGGLFSHFKREEDTTMQSGKFDEELVRMADIVDHLTPRSLLLFNESFSATNEREGSEIARQIVMALIEHKHRVVFVSHQYDFTHGMLERGLPTTAFFRAERSSDGARPFKLVEGEPLSTSFGEDVYREVFAPTASGSEHRVRAYGSDFAKAPQ